MKNKGNGGGCLGFIVLAWVVWLVIAIGEDRQKAEAIETRLRVIELRLNAIERPIRAEGAAPGGLQ